MPFSQSSLLFEFPANGRVRFTPNSDRKSRHPQKVMSALPPRADMCSAHTHVCYGPIADLLLLIRSLTLSDHQHPDKSALVHRTSHIGLTFGHVAAHNGARSQIVSCASRGA